MNLKAAPLIAVLILASATGWANEFSMLLPEPTRPRTDAASRSTLLNDFTSQLRAAIASRDAAQVLALYETNGATAKALKAAGALWQEALSHDPEPVSLYFKDLGRSPEESRRFWNDHVRRLTTREVTHLSVIRCGEVHMVVPLVTTGGGLRMALSDRVGVQPGAHQGGRRESEMGEERTGPGH